MLSSKGFLCRKCYDALYPAGLTILTTPEDGYAQSRSKVCRCGNLAVLWDEDMTPRLYVEDITTVQPVIVYHKDEQSAYEEVRRTLLKPLTSALYVDITTFKDTPLRYQTLAKKNKYERVTSTEYNTDLIAALDKYKHTTSDGTEEFLRTTHKDPLKGIS